jgi:serine/threonine protein kinase
MPGEPTTSQWPATCQTVSPPAPPTADNLVLAAGVRPLPEYELQGLLGRGGFSEVWKASGPGGISMALKFVRCGDNAVQIETRSLELMKNIRHAHLLSTFGYWSQDGLLIVAMELADRTLLDRLREVRRQGLSGIPAAELLGYMRDVARGLDYLNEPRHVSATGAQVGIQHKDVKPQNLLLVGGTVKVADFGLAQALEHTTTRIGTGLTPYYAAPEFLDGKATRWSDQYSLAVTYCELRGGRRPFEGNLNQVLAAHRSSAPDLSMLPERERPVVARALAKEPDKRWPCCWDFALALASAGADRPAYPDTRKTLEDAFAEALNRPALAVAREFFLPLTRALWGNEYYTLGKGDRSSVRPTISGLRAQEPDPNRGDLFREKVVQEDLHRLVLSLIQLRKHPDLAGVVLSREVLIGQDPGTPGCKRLIFGLWRPADGSLRGDALAAAHCHKQILRAVRRAGFRPEPAVPRFDPATGLNGLAEWARQVRLERLGLFRRWLPVLVLVVLALLPLLLLLPYLK